MRKIILAASAVALLFTALIARPAVADHGTEGTVTVAGVELCSNPDDVPGDGKCTWTAIDANGWVGTGPFTIVWTVDNGDGTTTTTTASCALGEQCSSADPDPIPVGAVVMSDGTGGGTFAAGDADGHPNG